MDLDPRLIAKRAKLRYIEIDGRPGIIRKKRGKTFSYQAPCGNPVRDPDEVARIRKLAIPPAYRDVWICPDPRGHLQGFGTDARGRRQYRYHPEWSAATHAAKYDRILIFGQELPKIRRNCTRDLRRGEMDRRKVLATVVRLLDKTLIRVGNQEYARTNGSYGLSTLRDRHVVVQKDRVIFKFKGKSGVFHEIDLQDPKLAAIVRECRDLPGQQLFQYRDEAGKPQKIHSQDVNEYLREISRKPFTAKDFRTWAATVLASVALRRVPPPTSATAGKKHLNTVVASVAERLGNTKAVCRKSYIHPAILDAYLAGKKVGSAPAVAGARAAKRPLRLSTRDEREVLRFLRGGRRV